MACFYDFASTVQGIKEGYILIIKRIINNHLNGSRLWVEKQCYSRALSCQPQVLIKSAV